MTTTTWHYPTPAELDLIIIEALAATGSGNSRSLYDWIGEHKRVGEAHVSVSPKLIGQSLKRNAEAGRVIRHGKNAAAKHTLPNA